MAIQLDWHHQIIIKRKSKIHGRVESLVLTNVLILIILIGHEKIMCSKYKIGSE